MFWTFVLIILVASCIFFATKHYKMHQRNKASKAAHRQSGSHYSWYASSHGENVDGVIVGWLVTGIVSVILMVTMVAVTASAQSNSRATSSAVVMISQLETQRDVLLEKVEDGLNADAYGDLLSAVPGDIDPIVVLQDPSQIMIKRVEEILRLNERVYTLENEVLNTQRAICDERGNLFIPRIPFDIAYPECKLDIQY